MAAMNFKDSLLPMAAAVIIVSLSALTVPASAVTCSLGMESHTPVSNGAVVNLRRGETVILNFKGDPRGPHEHLSIHDDYPGSKGVIWKNESSLNYKWYIEATEDGTVRIDHFDENDNIKLVFELTIQVHDIGSSAEKPAPEPCTTQSPEQTAPPTNDQVSHPVKGADSVKLIETQMPEDTTNVAERCTIYPAVVGVLIIIIVLLLLVLLVLVCILCRKCRRSKELQGERGQRITIVGGDVHKNGQLLRLKR